MTYGAALSVTTVIVANCSLFWSSTVATSRVGADVTISRTMKPPVI